MDLKKYNWKHDAETDTFSIENIEIMETFNSSTRGVFTEKDIDILVENFNTIKNERSLIPRVFVGHHGDETEREPAGFVEKIWRVGKFIMANIVGIPRKIFNQFLVGKSKKYPILPFRSAELSLGRDRLLGVALMSTAFPFCNLPMTAIESNDVELFSSVSKKGEVLCFSYACNQNSLQAGINGGGRMPDEKKIEEEEIMPEKTEDIEKYQDNDSNAVLESLSRLEGMLSTLLDKITVATKEEYAEKSDEEEKENSDKPSANSVASSENYSAKSLCDEKVYELAKQDKNGVLAMRAYQNKCFTEKEKENFLHDYQEKLKFQVPSRHRMTQFAEQTVSKELSDDEKILSKFENKRVARVFLNSYKDSLEQREHFQAKAFKDRFPTPETYIELYMKRYAQNPSKFNYLFIEGV